MTSGPLDLAQVRLDNAMLLFEEFVRASAKQADAATLRGLERRFAERVQIQPSYWSQVKGRSRQIGERLARQFEHLCHKPRGWMDEHHEASETTAGGATAFADDERVPQDDDERFIVGLVLTYYRRHPQRARTRLLDLLGEVLVPAAPVVNPSQRPLSSAKGTGESPARSVVDDGSDLWRRSSSSVAPLKQKK
jgi:hypothetical protein